MRPDPSREYDVIVVGGRPSGASLALRLGQAGLHVLLLERTKLPNAEIVSSPVIAPVSMHLLDEIGVSESSYARDTPRLLGIVLNVRHDFTVQLGVATRFGRDYVYAVERARFDFAIWECAASQPTVTALDQTPVVDLLWDQQRVVGVKVMNPDKTNTAYHGRCVVGADGRFSFVAGKVNAAMLHDSKDYPTSILYAYWKNLKPYQNGGPINQGISSGNGHIFLVLDSADNTTAIVVEGQVEKLTPPDGKSVEDHYLSFVRSEPILQSRLEGAEMIAPVRGIKNIGHFYRMSHGDGWALVGDALHAVDPIDGQGIFDALFTAKVLSLALIDWHKGVKTWEQAMMDYDKAVKDETFPMFEATLARRKTEIYAKMPDIAYKTALRWLLTDATYQERLIQYLGRVLPADNWLPRHVVLAAMIRGLFKDITGVFRRT